MKDDVSTPQLIWLHLYPGLLIAGLYYLITPAINHLGFPSLMSLMLSFLLVIVPFELGYLIQKAKKTGGRFVGLKHILINEKVEKKKFIGIIVLGIVTSILVAGMSQFVDVTIKAKVFSWLPDWYFYDVEFQGYSRNALLATGILRVFIDGMIIPYTEEMYFRGYLLPRMKGKGLATPILATILFAIYHFWQPWNYLSLIIISAILVFPAWYFKNYKVSLYIHLILNLLGSILFLLMIMNQS